jgi:hypothetical protein
MSSPILFYAIWIFFPILPAFVFFKFLPSKADVSGPFQGLEIKLGGAFGGYFLILLLSYSRISGMLSQAEAQKWVVTGNIALADAADKPQMASLVVHPPNPSVEPTGHFALELLLPTSNSEASDSPHLLVSCEGYQLVSVPIVTSAGGQPSSAYKGQSFELKIDTEQHRIEVVQPIRLEKEPSQQYNGNRPTTALMAVVPPPPNH